MAESTRCPHCGRPDALTADGVIERHRRPDWDRETSPGNEICLDAGLPVGEPCRHVMPSPHCAGREP